MGRGVRTVQRWERELDLPVHRVRTGPRSPVHAFPGELTAWLQRVDRSKLKDGDPHAHHALRPDGLAATSRVLVQRSSTLVQKLTSSIWTQRQIAESLTLTLQRERGTVRHRESEALHLAAAGKSKRASSRRRKKR